MKVGSTTFICLTKAGAIALSYRQLSGTIIVNKLRLPRVANTRHAVSKVSDFKNHLKTQ